MSADENLSGPQFFHMSNHEFEPGHVLTREGAWRANNPGLTAELDAGKRDYGDGPYYSFGGHSVLNLFKTNEANHPVEDHLYYGDRSLLASADAGMYGKNRYAVEHITRTGRPSKTHKPDPNYTREGMTGAYRTTNRLRVIGKVDERGNLL